MNFMGEFEKQDGIAFLIIYYSARNTLYYMKYNELLKFWNRAKDGGRKSIRYEELNTNYFMQLKNGCYVPFLEMLQKDLEERD